MAHMIGPHAYMRDPHVVMLRYRIEHSPKITFRDAPSRDNPPPLEGETDVFHMELADGIATFRMKKHYASESSTRQAVKQYLLPREIVETVRQAGTNLRFIFEESEVIDRDTSPGPRATISVRPDPTATVHEVVHRYPDPPESFVVSETVEVLWTLYEEYLQGHDRLLPMAYTVLTRLTYDAGGDDREAARKYQISKEVLRELRRISTSGTGPDARKWDPRNPPHDVTNWEKRWVKEAIKLLIFRAGQYAADPGRELPKITMSHIPRL